MQPSATDIVANFIPVFGVHTYILPVELIQSSQNIFHVHTAIRYHFNSVHRAFHLLHAVVVIVVIIVTAATVTAISAAAAAASFTPRVITDLD